MGRPAQDLTGERFGFLLVLRRDESAEGRSRWLCRCDCGTEKSVKADVLRNGKTISCGCARRGALGRRTKSRKRARCGRSTTLGFYDDDDFRWGLDP